MAIQCVGVIGAGQMGQGIAQTAAQSGFRVCVADVSLEAAQKGLDKISGQIEKMVSKQKLTGDQASSIMQNLKVVGSLKELKDCDLIIEAVSENLELKKRIWAEVDSAAKPQAIFVSNTSSISITELAAATGRPGQFAGMHFMNPVPIMKLVEGIRGIQTTDGTFNEVRVAAEKMGKTFVVARDMPGFAVNRILMPMINEAVYALYEGIASVEDIDTAMKLGTNQPMGPLTLADFIGLDTCLAIMEVLHEGLGDSKYRPCPLLRQYVTAGWMGKKSGRGFYKYE
ncbi:MAG: 3-hydroxybutyryl-CoA dehydrogenase [Bdellovibrionales bacterium]|nr:3-hydroxybutyryl-CoA dehydrogenase [Bdellovibrionales bacterium]